MDPLVHWKFHMRWDDPDLEWVTGPTGNRYASWPSGPQRYGAVGRRDVTRLAVVILYPGY